MADSPDVVNNQAAHRFEITLDGQTAFADYRLTHAGLVLPHTEVPERFRGRGIGGRLARAALQYAADHNLKVMPTCPFISNYIRRHPETHNLVHRLFRERLEIVATE